MNAIEIQNLNLNYKDLNILKDINITIKDKEFTAIVGPNGGGKTTLLKVILGLVKPSAGEVKVYGKMSSYKKNFIDRKITRLNSSHIATSRMPSSA